MNISVVITNYKKPEMLLESMAAVRRDCPSAQIIVSDVAADSVTGELVKNADPEAIYIGHTDNVGFARAVNAGYERATGEYLMVINSDVLVRPGAINKLALYLKENRDVGLVGPKILDPDGNVATSPRRFYVFPWTVLARRTVFGILPFGRWFERRHLMEDFDHDSTAEVDWILGEAMMTLRTHYNRVGGIDERFFLYFEDTDYSWEHWEHGLKVVYVGSAAVEELEPTGEINKARRRGIGNIFNKLNLIHIRSYLRFLVKHRFRHSPR